VGDMYEPIAEDKGIALLVHAPHEISVYGDRDLLIEAVANLVDNAVKFTPVGGQVEIGLFRGIAENILRVKDTGSGISEHECAAVLRRFYRSDKAKRTSGLGLGLNLVVAIVKLHGFRFTIVPGPGCVAEIGCPHVPTCREQQEPAKINALVVDNVSGTASGNSAATMQYLPFGNEQEFWLAHKAKQELGPTRTDPRDIDVEICDKRRRECRWLLEPIHSRNGQRKELSY
jgi:Histidine kinase-, DNA gyrase B-, and HSP90-like ATPase